jgi:ABC-type phosphate/phosphonate transport system ATPase subunit
MVEIQNILESPGNWPNSEFNNYQKLKSRSGDNSSLRSIDVLAQSQNKRYEKHKLSKDHPMLQNILSAQRSQTQKWRQLLGEISHQRSKWGWKTRNQFGMA